MNSSERNKVSEKEKNSKTIEVKQDDPRDPKNHSFSLKAHNYKNRSI